MNDSDFSFSGAGLDIRAVDPKSLSESDFVEIHSVSQDMWASEEGLGEFVQCPDCKKMYSKEMIFSHLSKEMFSKPVSEIMEHLGISEISCDLCSAITRFIYGSENIEMIKKRVLESVDSFLVLARDAHGKIVGFEEGYIDTIENIFERDLHYHYTEIGVRAIKNRVARVLGYTPENMLILSSIGFLKPYRNFSNLLEIMNRFSRAIPDSYMSTPGITELDKEGPIYRISENLWVNLSLGIYDDPELRLKISNMSETYSSDLIVCHNPVQVYKENFTKGIKHFLKASRRPQSHLLTQPSVQPPQEVYPESYVA